jgi:hypothetical protein
MMSKQSRGSSSTTPACRFAFAPRTILARFSSTFLLWWLRRATSLASEQYSSNGLELGGTAASRSRERLGSKYGVHHT